MTQGALNELANLTATMDVVTCKQQEKVWKMILGNTKIMVEACAADERASASLEVMEIIFSASMGFDFFMRIFALDQGIVSAATVGVGCVTVAATLTVGRCCEQT